MHQTIQDRRMKKDKKSAHPLHVGQRKRPTKKSVCAREKQKEKENPHSMVNTDDREQDNTNAVETE